MALPLAVEPPHLTSVAVVTPDHLTSTASTQPTNIVVLPCLLRQLTAIQLHVLGRVATHCWTHSGSIPYVPPNAHQRAVVRALAAAPFRLVVASMEGHRRISFRLTRLGEVAAWQVLHVVPAGPDAAREEEFDRMRRLMRHTWEPSGDPEEVDD